MDGIDCVALWLEAMMRRGCCNDVEAFIQICHWLEHGYQRYGTDLDREEWLTIVCAFPKSMNFERQNHKQKRVD